MMDLSRRDYSTLTAYLEPTKASAIFNDRVKVITKINNDVADWLLERRKLEDTYAAGLRKLARRPQPDAAAGLGIFELPWRRVVSSTEALAQSHDNLARGIETDVERPLREYNSKNSDMQAVASLQSELTSLVRELESAQKKAAKAKGKAGKSSAAAAAADRARAQYEPRAQVAFEKLQIVDEHRLNFLRDALTQLQTHEIDEIARNRSNAEGVLNSLLNLETADEIKTFAAKASGGLNMEPASCEQPAAAPVPVDSSAPLPPPPKITDDAASHRSAQSHQGRPSMASSSDSPRDQQRHTPLGGLRRLGTVMGRRRSIVQSSAPTSPDKDRKFRFAPFRKDSSRTFQPMGSQENGVGPDRPLGSSSSNRDLPTRSTTRNESISEEPQMEKPNGAVIPEVTPEEEAYSTTPTPVPVPLPVSAGDKPEPQVTQQQPPQMDEEGYSTKPDTVDEITRAQREAAGIEDSGINLTIRDKPIEEDEREAKEALDTMANTLRVQAQRTGFSRSPGTLRGRRDVRNTIFIPNPPSPEQTVSQVLAPAPSPGHITTPTPQSPASKPAPVTDVHQDDHPMSDNASVQSSHTLHSLSGPVSHPELQSPGLNVSIVEKLSVMLSEGNVTQSYVVGELAMAYNPRESKPPDSQLVRLDNFHVLEKVAANPQFVNEARSATPALESPRPTTANGQDGKGEYNVILPSITGPSPQVAFKYQVHLNPSNLSSYCPVIFTPIWNEEEFQASVIITYAVNPNFVSSQPPTSITLKNVALTVNLDLNPVIDETTKQPRDVARATGAAMYPNTASFRRRLSAVVWKIPELVVSANEDGKFLARFTTNTPWPRKGKVEAKFDMLTSDGSMRLGLSACLSESSEAEKDYDPFADDSVSRTAGAGSGEKTWKDVHTQRKLSVARYVSS